jgi:putative nucleotidyltransferase with HDIG domain
MPLSAKFVRRYYLQTVIAVGLFVVAQSLWQVAVNPPGFEWFVLAALTLLTGSFTVRIPGLPVRISVSETFTFTSVLLFGPAVGTLTVTLDALVISFWLDRSKRPPLKVFFNAAAPSIAIWVASEVFFYVSGAQPGEFGREDIAQLIIPVFAFAALYFFINTGLVAGALATERRDSVFRLWVKNFPGVSINYFVGGSIAMLIVAYTDRIDVTVLSIIIPLLFISYLGFRTSMGRLEDANRHVDQVNELYMSTIETLAMAVDAKDQITHGHIRRVQVYAIELAKRVGVAEDRQLKAIAAAALLHDMGKLAIPEHILNKPGRLSGSEFDRMKQHAGLGADLLSSIRFPYPVVPIVRHHHESWDGSGYPSGIAGTDIPLGARILSVVDCFDALTSDRPYRPRLSNDEAFAILRERRGTMYDSLIVDTFLRAYPEIGPAAIKAGQEARTIFPTDDALEPTCQPSRSLRQIRANATETALLAEFNQSASHAESMTDLFDRAAQCLRQLLPATVFALYRYRPESDSLVCEWTAGDPERLLDGLSIHAGQRITGWCGATQRTSVNSDAALDLAQVTDMFQPVLRSTLSIPLVAGPRLVGVLTAYSSREQSFNNSHAYIAEQVAMRLAEQLSLTSAASSVVSFSSRNPKPSS